MFKVTTSKAVISGVILAGALALNGAKVMAYEDDDAPVSKSAPVSLENYCHLRFPAIRQSTLGTNHPQLKSEDSGDIVDFYGPCDHDPLGKDEQANQKEEDEILRSHAYEG